MRCSSDLLRHGPEVHEYEGISKDMQADSRYFVYEQMKGNCNKFSCDAIVEGRLLASVLVKLGVLHGKSMMLLIVVKLLRNLVTCATNDERQMRMVGANGGNQFRQYAGQNVGYQNGYNAVQNVGNQVVQDAVQNQGVQNIGNHNGQIGVQNIGNGNVVAARAEGNAPGNNGHQIWCYNCRGFGYLD
ncbi:hypothetical protein Tco_0084798 [Tanacetum coccineum]